MDKVYKRKQSVKESVLTYHTPTQSSVKCKHLHEPPVSVKISNDKDLSKSEISKFVKQITKTMALFKNYPLSE